MNKWCTILILSTCLTGQALADSTEELDVTLVTPDPSRHAFMNIEDCIEDIDLQLSWELSDITVIVWEGDVQADVFLSTTSGCDKSVEIFDEEDILVSDGQETGKFPQTLGDLKVSDLVEDLQCGANSEQDYYLCIKFQDELTDQFGNSSTVTWRGGAELRWDVKPPMAPVLTSVSPGERNLKVNWELGDANEDDIAGFKLFWCPEDSCETPSSMSVTPGGTTDKTIEGLENFVSYLVWIAAVDDAENVGDDSDPLVGTPLPVKDFYEHYKDANGMEEGGFCFVATAAFGSYQAAMVQPLRVYRDAVLMSSAAGRELVSGYYRYGPRWARAIRGSETHRTLARWSLAPAVAFAEASNRLGTAETLVLLAGAIILMMLLFGFLRRLSGARKIVGPLVVVLMVLGLGSSAQAQTSSVPDFQLQLRLGPYYPDVDNEDGLVGEPFKDIYGSGSEVLFEMGIDYEIWQDFGILTAGASFGFVQYLGKALTESGGQASDTTVFNIMPFRLSLGYHFDVISTKFGIPLVPYLGGGLSYYVWWALDGVGDICEWENAEGKQFSASGGIFGLHFFGGLKLLLDTLDPEAATNFEAQVGVINTYFFAEYAMSWVDGFGSESHMDLSDSNFMFGLMMEF